MNNRGVRIRGAILLVLGIALAGFMAWLLGEISPIMEPGGSPTGARFTGTQDQSRVITTVLTGLLAIGVVFGLYGGFMAATGKESRLMKMFAWLLWAVLIGAALATGWTPRGFSQLF